MFLIKPLLILILIQLIAGETFIKGDSIHIVKLVNGKAEIDLDAVNQVLDKVGDKPVAIITVAGIKRIGKSFLLSYFLRNLGNNGKGNWFESQISKRFHWRNGSERDTTGMLWWSEPFYVNINGVETAILLMDTQGSFDDETTTHENASIFALSTLLSSTMIYYARSDISEELLQHLQLFAGYSRILNTNVDNIKEFQDSEEPFQNLMILIRDWSFEDYNFGYHDDQVPQPPNKNAKKDKIDPSPKKPREVQIVHRSILESFSKVSLYLLPYAGKKLAVKGDTSEMDPEFIEYYKGFVIRMLDPVNIQTKKIGSDSLTGTSLKTYVAKLRDIFLSAEVPEAKTIHDAMAEHQNTIALQTSMKGYEQMVKDGMNENGLSDDEFEELHKKAFDDSSNVFINVKKLGNKELRDKFQKLLNENIVQLYENFEAINKANKNVYETKQKLEQDVKSLKISVQEAEQLRKQAEKKHKEEIEIIKRRSNRIFPKIFKFIPGLNILSAIEEMIKDEL